MEKKILNIIPIEFQSNGLASRWVALEIIGLVLIQKKPMSDIKENKRTGFFCLLPEQKARTLSIIEAVLRNISILDKFIFSHVKKNTNIRVVNIIRIAAAEIFVDKIAHHAVVDSAVRLAKNDKNLYKYIGFINAVCRKLANKSMDEIIFSEPTLNINLSRAFEKIYGYEISKKFNVAQAKRPPIDITVKCKDFQHKYAKILNARVISSGSLRLWAKVQITSLSGYNEGDWWVQDFAAALPVKLLENIKGAAVLDVCAAPGGKTMQLAASGAKVTAVEVSKKRAEKISKNLERTKLKAKVVVKDMMTFTTNDKFDFIIVDPPCTSTGTIRRNFDLQYLDPIRRMPNLVKKQKEILRKSMSLLKNGGKLIYCTCSLMPEEGEKVIEEVVRKTIGWRQIPIEVEKFGIDHKWLDAWGGLRLRPDYWEEIGGMDGFYIALIIKEEK